MKEPLSPPVRLTEFEFRSRLPVIGGVISAFRQAWHGIAGVWAVRWLAQQQDLINRNVTEELDRQAAAMASATQAQIAALERVQALNNDGAARLAELVLRQSALSDALAALGGQHAALASALNVIREQIVEAHGQIAAVADGAARLAELQGVTRDQAAALTARVDHLGSVSQAYLEELGRELGELALRVGATGSPGDLARPEDT